MYHRIQAISENYFRKVLSTVENPGDGLISETDWINFMFRYMKGIVFIFDNINYFLFFL